VVIETCDLSYKQRTDNLGDSGRLTTKEGVTMWPGVKPVLSVTSRQTMLRAGNSGKVAE